MTLYEMNQLAYAKLPEITKSEDLINKKNDLITFIESFDDKYFMMLNHEKRYFTLFVNFRPLGVRLAEEMIDVGQSLGKLKGIEIDKKNNIAEFWIQGSDNICRMYAVFPYDKGVIEV